MKHGRNLLLRKTQYWDMFDEFDDMDRVGLTTVEFLSPDLQRIENMILGLGNDADSLGLL